ncbi:MAG: glycosyltransferase family 39 protein [Anaerolineae bacterium]|nr:glycosyltransferase family 39 protein [Anaerolineae bacterium]
MPETPVAATTNGAARAKLTSRQSTFFTGKSNWVLIVLLLLLGTGLAARQLKGAYWVDEVITEERAGAPIHGGPFSPAEIWQQTASTTYDQVPGYFWLIGAWDNVLGWTEYTTRLFSLLAGLLAVAWTYRLGRDLHSPLAGLAAATALIASAFFINFMHEARTYALLVWMGAVAIWLYWRIITRPTGWRTQAALVLVVAGLLYLHYFAALLIFSLCLYHLLFVPKNRVWWRVVLLFGLAGLLFLPWFLTSFDVVQGANSEEWRQDLSLTVPELIEQLLGSFANGSIALLLLAGALALTLRQSVARYVWFMLLGPLTMAVVINLWLGMLVTPKYVLYLWVPLALVFGIGAARLSRFGLHPALVLLPWLLVGTWSSLNWEEDPVKYLAWDVLHDELAGQVRAEDAIVFHLTAELWDGAHKRGLQHYFYDFPAVPNLLWSWPHAPDEVYLQDLPQILEGKQRVWSAYDPLYEPARITEFEEIARDRGFANCGRAARDPAMHVDLFERAPETIPFRFGGDLYQTGIQLTPLGPIDQYPQGDLRVPVGWQLGAEVPVNAYSLAVHVLDRSGALVAQADSGLPPNYDFDCQVVTVDVHSLPPGEYQVSLAVYAWETGTRLNAINLAGLSSGTRVALGTFTRAA